MSVYSDRLNSIFTFFTTGNFVDFFQAGSFEKEGEFYKFKPKDQFLTPATFSGESSGVRVLAGRDKNNLPPPSNLIGNMENYTITDFGSNCVLWLNWQTFNELAQNTTITRIRKYPQTGGTIDYTSGTYTPPLTTEITLEEFLAEYGNYMVARNVGTFNASRETFRFYCGTSEEEPRTYDVKNFLGYGPYITVGNSLIPLNGNELTEDQNGYFTYIESSMRQNPPWNVPVGNPVCNSYTYCKYNQNPEKLNKFYIQFSNGTAWEGIPFDRTVVINDLKFWGIRYTESEEEAKNAPISTFPEPEVPSYDPYNPEDPKNPNNPNSPLNPVSPGEQTAPGQEENGMNKISTGTGNKNSEIVEFPQQPGGTASLLGTTYIMNYNQMLKLQGEIWNPDLVKSITSLQTDISDPVISASMYPINLSDYGGVLYIPSNEIILGAYSIDMAGLGDVYSVGPNYNPKITIFEDFVLEGILGGFLDSEPYTTCDIWLPYIGLQRINGEIIFNKKIKLDYLFDCMNDNIEAILYIENKTDTGTTYSPIYRWSGNCAISISFNTSSYAQVRNNLILNTMSAGIMGNITKGNIVDMTTNTLNTTITYSGGSVSGSAIGRLDSQYVYFLLTVQETAIPSTYNQNYGRPSLISAQLSTLKGYTECENPLITTTATEGEKAEIIDLLRSGIYL